MSAYRSLFPGAMGPEGFISCFDDLLPDAYITRRIILKGGPGVGKSTFMRRAHAALCADGEPSELFLCSGDPESLDAVVLPRRGVILLDGTAPHVIDPQIPGARDTLVSLGDCLNESMLRPRLSLIRAVMADHAAHTRRAVACLKAACAAATDNAALVRDAVDGDKHAHITDALVCAALDKPNAPRKQMPRMRRVIADAVTYKGEMSLIAEHTPPTVIRLVGHYAQDLTAPLRAVLRAALAQGYDCEAYADPKRPGCLLHAGVPALGLLVTTSPLPPAQQVFDFSCCIPHGALLRREYALEQGRTDERQQIQRAIDALKAAKAAHDELESFYVPAMDFGAWQGKFDRTLATLRKEDA